MREIKLQTRAGLLFIAIATFITLYAHSQKLNITTSLDPNTHSLDGNLTIQYTNHSSDTLTFIWLQRWPNAYKNDQTAFSEYLLREGRTDFYFSKEKQRGYINRLAFHSGDSVLQQEDHPVYIDLLKVYLPRPLPPKERVTLSSPFHVKLPYNFDGFGYQDSLWHLRYWYPFPARYDADGWHPQPLTDGAIDNTEMEATVSLSVPGAFAIYTRGRLLDSLWHDSVKVMTYFFAKGMTPALTTGAGSATAQATVSSTKNISKILGSIGRRRLLPAIGFNEYDGVQLGILAKNLPTDKKWRWYAAPVFALQSKRLAGIGGVEYSMKKPAAGIAALTGGLNVSAFSTSAFSIGIGQKFYSRLLRFSPSIKAVFPTHDSRQQRWLELRSFLMGEKNLQYRFAEQDQQFHAAPGQFTLRYVNQLSMHWGSDRVLYPYTAGLQLQQGASFYRINAEGRYFFNYADGGGFRLRAFAAKFGWLGSERPFETLRYQPKLTAVRGSDDYTYSNYFIGRNEFDGFASQQIMLRDGGLKIRTDQFDGLQGRSGNWVASLNGSTSLPRELFPVHLPLRLFLDVGTYAEAWTQDNSNSRFLYTGGIQLSLFHELVNIYAPLVYSKVFRDNLRTVPGENGFIRKISFSIDIQRSDPFKLKVPR